MSFFSKKEFLSLLRLNSSLKIGNGFLSASKELKNEKYKRQCAQALKEQSSDGMRMLRRLSLVHLLLMHSTDHIDLI